MMKTTVHFRIRRKLDFSLKTKLWYNTKNYETKFKMTAMFKKLRNYFRKKRSWASHLRRKSNRRTDKSNVHYASHMTQITLCKLLHSSTIKSKSLKLGK